MAYLVQRSKNLLKIKGRTQATYDGNGPNTFIRSLSEDYYYVGLTANNHWYYWNVEEFIVEENKVKVKPKINAYGVTFPVRCKPNTKYKLSYSETNGRYSVGYYTENCVWISYEDGDSIAAGNYGIIVTPANCYWLTICITAKDVSQMATYTEIMLNEGEVALPYEAYGARVFKSNNLFDINKLECTDTNFTNNGDGSFTMVGYNDNAKNALSYYAPDLKAGETYTLSLKTDGNGSYIYLLGSASVWVSGRSRVLTQADLDKGFYVYGDNNMQSNPNYPPTRTWDFMINKGDTALPYEPYKAEPFKKVRVAYYKGKRIFLDRNFLGVSGSSTLASLARFKLSELSRMKLR